MAARGNDDVDDETKDLSSWKADLSLSGREEASQEDYRKQIISSWKSRWPGLPACRAAPRRRAFRRRNPHRK